MYLLDTNVVSELRRPEKADAGLVAWATSAKPSDLFISAVTVFELELGVLLALRKEPARGAALRGWLDAKLYPGFRGRTLPVDAAVAERAAVLHVPMPRPFRDSLIAATALVHRLTVVTRNERDFASMNAPLLNPWRNS
jgi:toxin FitB